MHPDRIEQFERERSRLRAIAYRMLGVPDDADDIVQEAWLRFGAVDRVGHDIDDDSDSDNDNDSGNGSGIDNPAAWLTTVVTRLAIDELRSARRRRERYIGPWLATPMLDSDRVLDSELLGSESDPGDQVVLLESISLGFLAMMERLSPLERAVFILHDVFAVPLADVAQVIGRADAATRQLARRARQHVDGSKPRFRPEPDDIEALTSKVLAAALNGDLEALGSFLASDVVHLSDGGAERRAARAPVVGRDRVARFFVNLAQRTPRGAEFHVVRVNGQQALYTTVDGEPFMLHVSNWVDGLVTGSYAVLNPAKLSGFHAAWLAALR